MKPVADRRNPSALDDLTIEGFLISAQLNFVFYLSYFLAPTYMCKELLADTDEPDSIVTLAAERHLQYLNELKNEERLQFDKFCTNLEPRVRELMKTFQRTGSDTEATARSKAWMVLNEAAKSAPVFLLGWIIARTTDNQIEKSSADQLALPLAFGASVFPHLFIDVEQVESMRWLASVRDFKSLTSAQQDSFLDDIGRRFGIDTTCEEWKRQKEACYLHAQLYKDSDLPPGLLSFKNWGKLGKISPDDFDYYETTIRIRLNIALIFEHVESSNWISRLRVGYPEIASSYQDISDRVAGAIDEASRSVRTREERREERRAEEARVQERQLEESLKRAAEAQAIEIEQLGAFHCEFQKTPIEPASEKLLENFSKAAVKQTEQNYRADFLNTVELIRELYIDYRGKAPDKKGDPTIKQLADTLLSPTNLTILADVLGNDTAKHFKPHTVPDHTPVITSAETLGSLYAESLAVRGQLDAIVGDASLSLVVATVVLPISEVRSFISSARLVGTTEEERKKLHQAFSSKIWNALISHKDIRTVKSLRYHNAENDARTISMQTTTIIPDWLNAKMEQYSRYLCFVDPRDGAILIFDKEDPDIFFEVPKPRLKSADNFDAFFDRALDTAYKTKEYGELLKELMDLGFNVEITTGDKQETHITHSGAQMDQVFSGDIRDIKKLSLLKAKFEEYLGLSEALVEFATEVGFSRSETTASGEATLKLAPESVIVVPAAITQEQFTNLTIEITTLIERHHSAEELQQRRERNRQREVALAEREVKPKEGERILIVDANVLLMWSAPVPGLNDTTFLEVLQAYASQTGSRIWIPARVLYEVLGDVSFLNSDNQVEQVSIRTYSQAVSKPISKLVDGAAHLALLDPDDGSTHEAIYRARRGAHSHVTIVYTPEDLDFLRDAQKVGEDSREKERFAKSHIKKDLGDYAITDILDRFDITGCDVHVVTTDRVYAEVSMPKKTRSQGDVTWKKPFSILYSAMGLGADTLAGFPSADEAKKMIWEWNASPDIE